jgi:hypothetical protein
MSTPSSAHLSEFVHSFVFSRACFLRSLSSLLPGFQLFEMIRQGERVDLSAHEHVDANLRDLIENVGALPLRIFVRGVFVFDLLVRGVFVVGSWCA